MSEKWMVKNPWFRRVFRDTYEEACRWMEKDVQKATLKYEGQPGFVIDRGENEIKMYIKDFYLHWQVVQR